MVAGRNLRWRIAMLVPFAALLPTPSAHAGGRTANLSVGATVIRPVKLELTQKVGPKVIGDLEGANVTTSSGPLIQSRKSNAENPAPAAGDVSFVTIEF